MVEMMVEMRVAINGSERMVVDDICNNNWCKNVVKSALLHTVTQVLHVCCAQAWQAGVDDDG